MHKLEKILYTGVANSTGGREGQISGKDPELNLSLSTPKGLGGDGGEGTNPEQLFAAGYSACFIGAMKAVATKEKIKIPDNISIEGHVGIGPINHGYCIKVELKITLPGMDRNEANDLINKAHMVCPYSNATRGNIEVTLTLI
ncbi:MAG: ohr [Burkholderiales bacterium]|jgi:Ohr subfamily peroxiredoxin|nr:ohr [Burkholderiales bacterium]